MNQKSDQRRNFTMRVTFQMFVDSPFILKAETGDTKYLSCYARSRWSIGVFTREYGSTV